jgi:hypothetical protein
MVAGWGPDNSEDILRSCIDIERDVQVGSGREWKYIAWGYTLMFW